MDHRWGCRVPVDVDVQLTHRARAVGAGQLKDISISGAFVQTSLSLPLLARIRIIAQLKTSGGTERHDATAYVVRRTAMGVGVEWSELAPVLARVILTDAFENVGSPPLRQTAGARA